MTKPLSTLHGRLSLFFDPDVDRTNHEPSTMPDTFEPVTRDMLIGAALLVLFMFAALCWAM